MQFGKKVAVEDKRSGKGPEVKLGIARRKNRAKGREKESGENKKVKRKKGFGER